MGGEIGLESAAGSGSTFWCTLPFALVGTAARDRPSFSPPPGTRILIADAELLNAAILDDCLGGDRASSEAALGTRNTTANDAVVRTRVATTNDAVVRTRVATANDAVAALQTTPPYGVVILDHALWTEGGEELAQVLERCALEHGTRLLIAAPIGLRHDPERFL